MVNINSLLGDILGGHKYLNSGQGNRSRQSEPTAQEDYVLVNMIILLCVFFIGGHSVSHVNLTLAVMSAVVRPRAPRCAWSVVGALRMQAVNLGDLAGRQRANFFALPRLVASTCPGSYSCGPPANMGIHNSVSVFTLARKT